MGVIGSSSGGYATVNPTQGNPMGDAMSSVENSMFNHRADRRERENNEAARQKAERDSRVKELEDSDKWKKENPFVATGITDVDSQNRAALENAMTSTNEAKSNYAATGDKKYLAQISNIQKGVDEMKSFSSGYNTHVTAIAEGTADGTYNIASAKNIGTRLDETQGKIVRRFDKDGNSIFDVFKENDEGVITVVKQGINSKQLREYTTPVKAFHIDGLNSPPGFKGKTLVDAFNVNVDKPLTEYIGTGLNRKKKVYSPNAPQVAKTMAETSIKSKDNLYELFTRMGLDPEDSKNYEDYQTIDDAKNYLEKLLLANSPEVISEDPDTALASLEESKRQHNASNAISRANLKISQDRLNQETNTTTVTDSVDPLTGRPIRTETYRKTTKGTGDKKETPAKKEISRSDLAAKAKASGYSTKEYEALLLKKGISIKS